MTGGTEKVLGLPVPIANPFAMEPDLPDIMDGSVTLAANPVGLIKAYFFTGCQQENIPVSSIMAIETPPFVLRVIGENNIRMVS